MQRITDDVLDDCARRSSGDFVHDISARITIAVIAEMLGVPASDRGLLFRWTNEIIAPQDPEYQTGGNPEETLEKARMELFQYFDAMSKDRQKHPQDDIVSVVANGNVDGATLGPVELLSYYLLLVVAGNETTRNAMTGGMLAFLDNPGEWRKLQSNPGLLDLAVEEIVRWTTPVIQFCRTATRDYALRGKIIREGRDRLPVLPVGESRRGGVRGRRRLPHRPRPEPAHRLRHRRARLPRRAPRPPRAALRASPRCASALRSAELAGPIERVRSSFVGGIKRAPMRWEIAAR